MKKEGNGLIFDDNESEEFQTLEMVNTLVKPGSDKSLPKMNADEYNEFKIYLKRIKILNEEVVFNNEFYGMCVKEFHHKHNYHHTLKMETYEMTVREADLIKRIGDLEVKNNTLEENLHYVHEKINWMYEHMSTLTADD